MSDYDADDDDADGGDQTELLLVTQLRLLPNYDAMDGTGVGRPEANSVAFDARGGDAATLGRHRTRTGCC